MSLLTQRSPHGEDEVREMFGDIRLERVNGELSIVSPPHWEERCMVIVRDLPGYEGRPLYVNRSIEEYLRAALTGATIRRPDYKIRTLGCFNPRLSRTTSRLSTHSWGIAVDLNADTNPLQHLMNLTDPFKTDIPMEWVEEFERAGFLWGGKFKGLSKDPMHMQWATGF
jgi:hypothetical protein